MEKYSVPNRSIYAAVVLWFVKNRGSVKFRENCPAPDREIYAMTDKVIELKEKNGLDTKNFSIRCGIGGYTSDDIDSFVHRFVLFGSVSDGPLEFSEEVLDLCREILRDDHKEEPQGTEKLVEALELGFFD